MAAQLNPNDSEVYDLMGNLYDVLQQYSESVICYKKAITLDPDNAKFYNNIGAVYHELK